VESFQILKSWQAQSKYSDFEVEVVALQIWVQNAPLIGANFQKLMKPDAWSGFGGLFRDTQTYDLTWSVHHQHFCCELLLELPLP